MSTNGNDDIFDPMIKYKKTKYYRRCLSCGIIITYHDKESVPLLKNKCNKCNSIKCKIQNILFQCVAVNK